jgi:hypothetical protein
MEHSKGAKGHTHTGVIGPRTWASDALTSIPKADQTIPRASHHMPVGKLRSGEVVGDTGDTSEQTLR